MRREKSADAFKRTSAWQKSHQAELYAAARSDYASASGAGPQRFLSRADWQQAEPVLLDAVTLSLAPRPVLGDAHYEALRRYWPVDPTGAPLERYHEVLGAYQRPGSWFNGRSYRLTGLERAASGAFQLEFSLMTYWDGLDSWGALAYEAAHTYLASKGSGIRGPYRSRLKDPFDLAGRNCALGISVLTIRREQDGGSTFYLHHRTTGVATLTGMIGCLPAGEFQPSAGAEDAAREDLDIWRCMMREYAEEFLGAEEFVGSPGAVVDYDESPFREMQSARSDGAIRPYVLDIGIDPLTWKAGIRLAYIFDAPAFDAIFQKMVHENAEGPVLVPVRDGTTDAPIRGWPLDEETVGAFLADRNVTEAMKQCLDLTWRHRAVLGLQRTS